MDFLLDANLSLPVLSVDGRLSKREFLLNALQTYDDTRRAHDVRLALADVEIRDGEIEGINELWRDVSSGYPWLAPLWSGSCDAPLPVETSKDLGSRARGISLHPRDASEWSALLGWPNRNWTVLQEKRALVRIHGRPPSSYPLQHIVAGAPGCVFLFADLGSPGSLESGIHAESVEKAMTPLFETAALANVRVILSGLCATSPTPWAYPHPEAWPVLDALLGSFGSERLLWGSSFPRCAEYVSFPQTVHAVERWCMAKGLLRSPIFAENLRSLLAA